jgi:hypothetical protein
MYIFLPRGNVLMGRRFDVLTTNDDIIEAYV